MRNLVWTLVFAEDVLAFVLAAYKFHHREWASGALLALIGASSLSMAVWSLRTAALLDTPLGPADPAARIVMRATSGQLGDALLWAVGFLGVAVGLAENPEVLWTRWLTWPVALVALVLSGVVMWAAGDNQLQRFVADSQGFDTHAERPCSPPEAAVSAPLSPDGEDGLPCERILWSQVGAVKRIERRPRTSNSRRNSLDRPTTRELVFFDRSGHELLRIDDALDPPERYKLFLESIPRWTGLPVTFQSTR